MKTCCELCGTPTNEKLSYLELETWEFASLMKEKKDFYYICFDCFDKETDKLIEKDSDTEVRKQRAVLFEKLMEEEFQCPACDGKLTLEHICQSN